MSTLKRVRTVLKWTAVVALLLVAVGLGSFVVLSSADNPLTTNGLPLYVLLGVFLVAWLGVVVVDFYRGMQEPADQPSTTEVGDAATPEAPGADGDAPTDYLARFARLNLSMGLLVGGFLGAYLLADAVVAGGSPQILGVVHGFLAVGVRVFGGVGRLVVVTGVFLGVWYGLRQAASEALVAGLLAWGLLGLVGLSTLASSTSGVGFVIASAYGLYYGARAWGTTESVLATQSTAQDY